MTRVLVLGLDPRTVPGYDPQPVLAALEQGRQRFEQLGVSHHVALLAYDEDPAEQERQIIEALRREPYECVVVGGGIRTDEDRLQVFERIINLVRRYAPQAAIAFNDGAADTADSAQRWLHSGSHPGLD